MKANKFKRSNEIILTASKFKRSNEIMLTASKFTNVNTDLNLPLGFKF